MRRPRKATRSWACRSTARTAPPSRRPIPAATCGCCGSTRWPGGRSCRALRTSRSPARRWRCFIPGRPWRSARCPSRKRWCSTARRHASFAWKCRARPPATISWCAAAMRGTTAGWSTRGRASAYSSASCQPAAPVSSAPWRKGEIPQEKAVAFGARWRNIARMQLADRQRHGRTGAARAVRRRPGRLRRSPGPHRHGRDLRPSPGRCGRARTEPFRAAVGGAHPARRRRCPRASSAASSSRAPRRRFAAFDVSLHTPEGSPVATFEGFSLRGVNPEACRTTPRGARREPSLHGRDAGLRHPGRRRTELFARDCSPAARDVVVSSILVGDQGRRM